MQQHLGNTLLPSNMHCLLSTHAIGYLGLLKVLLTDFPEVQGIDEAIIVAITQVEDHLHLIDATFQVFLHHHTNTISKLYLNETTVGFSEASFSTPKELGSQGAVNKQEAGRKVTSQGGLTPAFFCY